MTISRLCWGNRVGIYRIKVMIEVANNTVKSTSKVSSMVKKLGNCLSNFSQFLLKISNLTLDRIQFCLLSAMDGLLLFLLLDGVDSKRL